MADQLYPVDIPPGLVNNGTTYQAKGRWHAGNFVRFFNGTVQPIGGWVKRTLTGAAILGEPTTVVAWTLNDGTPWIAVGTTTSLYVIDKNNVVYDIGLGWADAPGTIWQLAPFGSYLVAVNSSKDPTFATGNVWVWMGDPGTPINYAGGALVGDPTNVFGCFTTGERFLVALQGTPPAAFPDYPTGYVP